MAEFTAADRKCNNNTAQGQPSCLLREVCGFSETSFSFAHSSHDGNHEMNAQGIKPVSDIP